MRRISEAEFKVKYDLYSQIIFNIAYTYLKSKDSSNDCVQETFMRYLNNEKEFVSLEDEKYYVIRIAVNVSKTLLRHNKKIVNTDLSYLGAPNEDSSRDDALFNAINALGSKYKDVIILYYYEELSIKEVAQALHISEDAAKKRLERARNTLKEMGGKYGF